MQSHTRTRACTHTHTHTHTQEGMPGDEQSKAMLYHALKLRLSLVGSMLGSICVSEQNALEWTPLLMQLICSGAVDRQPDTRYILHDRQFWYA